MLGSISTEAIFPVDYPRHTDLTTQSTSLHSHIGTALTFANLDTATDVLQEYLSSARANNISIGFENTMSDAITVSLDGTISKAAREAWPRVPSGQFTIERSVQAWMEPKLRVLGFDVDYTYVPQASGGERGERLSTGPYSYAAWQGDSRDWFCCLAGAVNLSGAEGEIATASGG